MASNIVSIYALFPCAAKLQYQKLHLTGIGVVIFAESLNCFGLAGIVQAIAALVLLMRWHSG
jgi:hypothetical protein